MHVATTLRQPEAPFPGLQLVNRIIVVEGSAAAVLYALQGVHRGPFAGLPATGRLIEAFSAEFFDIGDEGRLTTLKSVTRLDHVEAQIRGPREVPEHRRIDLMPFSPLEPGLGDRLRHVARSVYSSDPDARAEMAASAIAPEAMVDTDGVFEVGPRPWAARWDHWQSAFTDLGVTVRRVLKEGRRVVVGYEVDGTHEGVYQPAVGDALAPTGRKVTFDVVDFLEFGTDGRIQEIVSVHNSQDVRAQVVG